MHPTTPFAELILDTAADVIVDDGVDALGFGTIASRLGVEPERLHEVYPLFEELLAALLARQNEALARIIADNVERDPRGGLPSRIFGYALSAVYENRLATALYLTDPSGLDRITRALGDVSAMPYLSFHRDLIAELQAVGMARDDIDPYAVTAVINCIGSGILVSAQRQGLDAIADGLVAMLERAVDAEVTDTSPGKIVFFRYAESLAVEPLPR